MPGVTVKLVDQLVLGLVTVPVQALAPVAMRLSSSASLDELGMKEVQKSEPMVLWAWATMAMSDSIVVNTVAKK